jgi:hypothetical protein
METWSLFDHTCLVFGDNIRSVQSLDNCPTIVSVGGASIRLGEHMLLPKDTPLSNLWLTLLQGGAFLHSATGTAQAPSPPDLTASQRLLRRAPPNPSRPLK